MEMHRTKRDAEPDHDRPKRRLSRWPRTQVRSRLLRPRAASWSPGEVHARRLHSSRWHLTMAITVEIDHARARAGKTKVAAMPVVPLAVRGPIRRIKWAVLVVTLGVYYLAPFLRWDRGIGEPNQAILLDFERGRFYGFFIEIWPQELYYITGLMILAAAILILVNALAGRLWCGFACPQTVWTDLFLLVERLIEGDRRDRLKKIGAPLTLRRVAEIGTKHACSLLISFATSGALVFYFTDAPTLVHALAHGGASVSVLAWITIFAGTTFGLAGFAREQVCTFMCPWPGCRVRSGIPRRSR